MKKFLKAIRTLETTQTAYKLGQGAALTNIRLALFAPLRLAVRYSLIKTNHSVCDYNVDLAV